VGFDNAVPVRAAGLGAPPEHTPQTATQPDEDRAALYQDLLTRANGDTQLVSLWLAEMGYDPAQFAGQQQQQAPRQEQPATIKAVGTRHTLGSWASAGNCKSRLVGSGSPGTCMHGGCGCDQVCSSAEVFTEVLSSRRWQSQCLQFCHYSQATGVLGTGKRSRHKARPEFLKALSSWVVACTVLPARGDQCDVLAGGRQELGGDYQ